MVETLEKPETGEELYTFQVLEGEHCGNRRIYKKGDCFESNYPLDTMFINKFQRIPNKPLPADDRPRVQGRTRSAAEATREMMSFTFDEASNVTHMFPVAAKADLEVYKDSLGGYAVVEKGAMVKVNLADQILGSKKKVTEFLSAYEPVDLSD